MVPEDREGKLQTFGLQIIRSSALSNADEKRLNDIDGRGFLSERGLSDFCEFMLQTALDQIEFMQQLLDVDTLQKRILGSPHRKESAKELPSGSGLVLRDVFLRGELNRGKVVRIMRVSARTAQSVIARLLKEGLIISSTPKGPVKIGFSSEAAGHYFPNLFPAGSD